METIVQKFRVLELYTSSHFSTRQPPFSFKLFPLILMSWQKIESHYMAGGVGSNHFSFTRLVKSEEIYIGLEIEKTCE